MTRSLTARALAACLATLALAGCGKAPMTAAPLRLAAAQDVVGLPANYRAGEPVPGADGTPSLRSADFPHFTHAADGGQSDPVNVLVSGTEGLVRTIFARAGWLEADKHTPGVLVREFFDSLLDKPYPTGPMSELYLYNRVQDMSLQKNGATARNRDHLRVWKTPLRDHLDHPFWAIAATHDIALKWAAHMALPTHEIAPDVDSERALVVSDFTRSGHVTLQYPLQSLPENFHGVNAGGDEFFTDGRVMVLELR